MRPRHRNRVHFVTNRLRVLRAERRWTQDDVAYRLGLGSKFRYWQVENEQVEPTEKERTKLAKMFGVSQEDIWPTPVRRTMGVA